MEKVTYIIPIHDYNEEIETYLTRAINSLKNLRGAESYDTIFVGDKDILDKCSDLYKKIGCGLRLTLVPTDDKDIFSKINLAVMQCVTPYFSVLEFDDNFYEYWDEVAQNELKKERYSVLLPMIEYVKTDFTVPSLGNEMPWDAAFATDLGFVNMEELKIFKDLNVTGGYLNTEDFISLGGLKPSLKIAAWYEYLLRVLNNDKKIRVSPRIGYMHTIFRDGSYMIKCQDSISQDEGKWLIEQALKVYDKKKDTGEVFKK